MDPHTQELLNRTRRHFLRDCHVGLGGLALACMAHEAKADPPDGQTQPNPLAPRPSHFAGRAKNVIYLHMAGSPPHLDLFDYKPELVRHSGEPCPESFLRGRRFAFTSGVPRLLGTPQRFAQRGAVGAWFSAAVPHLATIADELTFIKSMTTDQFNHAPAELLLFTGSPQFGRPSMGSWVTYGLGSESQNLPGFIVLVSSGTFPSAGNSCWSNGFLPSVYQGVQCRSQGDPVLYVSNPAGMDRDVRRLSLDALRDLNEMQAAELGSPETRTRIAQYELAFRMQTAVPEVMDIAREPRPILDAYGAQPGGASLANNCLLARRLVEQRRALRAAARLGLGLPRHRRRRGYPRRSGQQVPHHGPCRRRADPRSEAARPARRDAGHLGRRVRPFAIPRGPHREQRSSWAATITRSRSRCSWPAAVPGPASPTARPMSWASTLPPIRSRRTICKRRCCTCSAWTTCG